MKPFLHLLLFTLMIVVAGSIQRDSQGEWPFQLTAVRADSGQQICLSHLMSRGDLWFNPRSQKIHDVNGYDCAIQDNTQHFQCIRGVTGTTKFGIVNGGDNHVPFLVYIGDNEWTACPDGAASGATEKYNIFGGTKAGEEGCFEVQLAMKISSTPRQVTSDPESGHAIFHVHLHSRSISGNRLPATAAGAPRSCAVAASAPTLAPSHVYVGPAEPNQGDYYEQVSRDANITTANSTVFQFLMPAGFPGNSNSTAGNFTQTCGLQFRFPVCDGLPKGYPCYMFSGDEQEVLSDSGMAFWKVEDDINIGDWQGQNLTQIFLGRNTMVGTFACGGKVDRPLAWFVNSVNGFELDFLQGGGSSGFTDGVGVWIVSCQ